MSRQKFRKRIKQYLFLSAAILISLIASFLSLPIFLSKKSNIPVLPYSFLLKMKQRDDYSLVLQDLSVSLGYAPDYQTRFDSDYYLFSILSRDKVVFTGSFPKINLVVSEDLRSSYSEYKKKKLDDFELALPFFSSADKIVFFNEKGDEVLRIDLSSFNLSKPNFDKSVFCGDGVCADNENFISCFKDCGFKTVLKIKDL